MSFANYPTALKQDSILHGRYIIREVLGQGGFGITYKAIDYKTNSVVAIKEYYPSAIATRSSSYSVQPQSERYVRDFEYGKQQFLEEASTLSEFIGNPNIVKVYRYFEEPGTKTAYFVMEYVQGISLSKYLKEQGGRISWEKALELLLPVADALSEVHSKSIVHRDIKPDNIMLTEDMQAKVLDFGAARYVYGMQSNSLETILTPGFAPMEQYYRRGHQGPWTDVYALAATIYCAITGKVPPEATERIVQDTLQTPAALGIAIPDYAEAALLKALNVNEENRYRTMEAFKNAMQDKELLIKGGRLQGNQKSSGQQKELQEETERLGPGIPYLDNETIEIVKGGKNGGEETEKLPKQGQKENNAKTKRDEIDQQKPFYGPGRGRGEEETERKPPYMLIAGVAVAAAFILFLVLFLWPKAGRKEAAAEVSYTILCKDTEGEQLKEINGAGKVGEKITIKSPPIEGYEAQEESGSLTPSSEADENVITFYYTKTSQSKSETVVYTVVFRDSSGNDLGSVEKEGYAGDTVTETAPEKEGFHVDEDRKSLTLEENEPDNTITFIYTPDQSDHTSGKVAYTISCMDASTGESLSEETWYGIAEETFTITAPEIEGYVPRTDEKTITLSADEGKNDFVFVYEPSVNETVAEESFERSVDIPNVDTLVYGGHTYYVMRTGSITSFREAEEYCQSRGGHLAVINDDRENEALWNFVFDTLGYDHAYFGLTDVNSEGYWEWVDGSAYSYERWADGEPDNLKDAEHYALFYYKTKRYRWNDGDFGLDAEGKINFLIEWDQ